MLGAGAEGPAFSTGKRGLRNGMGGVLDAVRSGEGNAAKIRARREALEEVLQ